MTKAPVVDKERMKQIKAELKEAGVNSSPLHPFTTNYLPRVLHDDEHIVAAIYGRKKESEGLFGIVEGLLVATNMRVIFLDHRPGYTTMDEISYDVITGANLSSTLLYASIILFTKIANYKLSFANHASAQNFVDYIESRVLEHKKPDQKVEKTHLDYEVTVDDNALEFLSKHDIGVLSTTERTGTISGAVIYYTMRDGSPYFMTKENSRKADNIIGDQHVSLVVFDEAKLQTAQIQGIVEQVIDENVKVEILTALMRPRTYGDGSHKPPILRMSSAGIQTYKITPTKFTFTDYSNL